MTALWQKVLDESRAEDTTYERATHARQFGILYISTPRIIESYFDQVQKLHTKQVVEVGYNFQLKLNETTEMSRVLQTLRKASPVW